MRLQNKVAHVTGAGHGIGRAIARRFAEEGARVLATDMDDDAAADLVREIEAAGGQAGSCRLDVRQSDEVPRAIAFAVERWGRLDIQVSNAGITDRCAFTDMTPSFWHNVIDTNLTGCFLCGQAAAQQMIAQGGGRIVNIASNSGIFGGMGRAAYGASKAGIINLTQTMAIELAEAGIIVNALAPGPTKVRDDQPDTPWDSVMMRMPLKRWGDPAEIAAAAVFLASDECSFTTGHVLSADGGFTVAGIMEG